MRKFIVIPFEKYSRLTSKTNEQEVADKPNDAVSNIDLLTDRTEALKNTFEARPPHVVTRSGHDHPLLGASFLFVLFVSPF